MFSLIFEKLLDFLLLRQSDVQHFSLVSLDFERIREIDDCFFEFSDLGNVLAIIKCVVSDDSYSTKSKLASFFRKALDLDEFAADSITLAIKHLPRFGCDISWHLVANLVSNEDS